MIVGKSEKLTNRFSPAFFKSGPGGVGGWQPPHGSPDGAQGYPWLSTTLDTSKAVALPVAESHS